MKLIVNNNVFANSMRHHYQQDGVARGKLPQNSSALSFGAKIPSKFNLSKLFASHSIELTDKQITAINDAIGGNYFIDKLKSLGLDTDTSSIKLKETGLAFDLAKTIEYPLHDMWLDIASAIGKKTNSIKPNGILANYMEKTENEKNLRTVLDIVSQYNKDESAFGENLAGNITKSSKNYRSRDERTLNRMLTSTVSALYSANDFYNISILQQDDKDKASKAHKSRLKQEMSRMALSAGLTFVTMGALDKHIKNNILLSAASIAISALISEVGSRLINKIPLLPLTPEQAKKYAQEKNINNEEQTQQQNPYKHLYTHFTADNSGNIFKDFAQNDGTFTSLKILKTRGITDSSAAKNENSEQKKKIGMGGVALIAIIACSLAKILSSKTKIGKNTSKLFKNMEDFITSKKETVTGKELDAFKEKLEKLAAIDNASPVFKTYQTMLKDKNSIELKSDRFFISGLYNGVTKIFKTIYTILSLPGIFVSKAMSSPKTKADISKSDNKALAKLYSIFKKNNNDDTKIIEEVEKLTRNFEPSIETGDLANISRTLVTAISTYFFVNDYRNKVLIESNGEDTKGAGVETKQRLGHKLANFIINGTIMNVGNSVFKGPLNNSLLAAGLIAIGEETLNEALVRKSTCQPIGKMQSRQDIIDFEEKQLNKKGPMGAWSRLFRKITGKKTLCQKAGNSVKKTDEQKVK